MKRLLAASLLLVLAVPALAQQPTKLDPRLAEPALNVIQAQAAYLSAQVQIAKQDLDAEKARREAIEKWVRDYFGLPSE